MFYVQSVRNVSAICLPRSLSATLTASKRTEPVTGDSTLLTGQPTSRWDVDLIPHTSYLEPPLRFRWKPINKNTNTLNIGLQVFEDYSEEEQEKYKEELETIKKRFSHTKLKRKWVSFSKVFFRLWDIYDWSEKSFSPLFTGLASADNKGSLIFKTQSSKLVANLFIGCIWYRNTTTGPLVTACITTLHRVVMGGYFRLH